MNFTWSGRAVVYGLPQSMGSKRLGRINGRPVIIDAKDRQLRSWQGELRAAMLADAPESPLTGPVEVWVEVVLPRPKSHYGTGKNADKLKPTAPTWAPVRPDGDKILRAGLDCLTGLWVRDDAQAVMIHASKRYGARPQTTVRAMELREAEEGE